MPHSQPDPLAVAEQYLAQSGHSLEHEVARVVADQGWTPTMALQLPGRDGNPRDCDVLAQRCFTATERDGGLKCSAIVLMECKHIPADRVWILMGMERVHEPTTLPSYIPNDAPQQTVLNAVRQPTMRKAGSRGVREVSIGIVEARAKQKDPESRSDRDTAFAAVSKVVDLSWAMIGRPDPNAGAISFTVARFVIPLVVVRGSLVRAVYRRDQNRLVPERVDSGYLLHAVPPLNTRVTLCTNDALPRVLKELEADAARWSRMVLTRLKHLKSPSAGLPWKPLIELAKNRPQRRGKTRPSAAPTEDATTSPSAHPTA